MVRRRGAGRRTMLPRPQRKQRAADYAQGNRFNGSSREIYVCDKTGSTTEKIAVTGERPFGA